MTRPNARHAATALIGQALQLFGGAAQLASVEEREWASATFAGARYRLCCTLPATLAQAQIDAAISALPDHEFTLPGLIVADCTAHAEPVSADGERRVIIELLTIVAD